MPDYSNLVTFPIPLAKGVRNVSEMDSSKTRILPRALGKEGDSLISQVIYPRASPISCLKMKPAHREQQKSCYHCESLRPALADADSPRWLPEPVNPHFPISWLLATNNQKVK